MNLLIKKISLFFIPVILFLAHLSFTPSQTINKRLVSTLSDSTVVVARAEANSYANLYTKLNLLNLGLSQKAFQYGLEGYEYLRSKGKLSKDSVLTILDFSLPSTEKRLFVIDLKNAKLLFNTYVAHGRNSGTRFASEFSNKHESYKSSQGFYITRNTYHGKHGFSLRLNGEEKGINDNALSRAIVMHAADYVNKNLIRAQGYIGRSLGCPALPNHIYKPIINEIKDGSLLFIYSPANEYESKSPVLIASHNEKEFLNRL